MKKAALFALLTLSIATIGNAQSTTAATDPVGFVTKTVPAGSDATYAPAMQQPSVFAGTIATIPNGASIQASGAPGWTTNQFTTVPNYVQVTSGNRTGLVAQITGNTADTLTLAFPTQDLGTVTGDKVVVGDSFKIVPYWTLGTLLPQSAVPNGTLVLLYNRTQSGVNLSASNIFTMFTGFGWFNGPTDGTNQIIDPDESIVIRAPSGQQVSLTQTGAVQMAPVRTTLQNVTASTDQDIRVTTGLPVPIGLGSFLNLGAPEDGDKVLIFDDAATGQNKSALFIATFFNGFGWFNGPTDETNFQLQPGQGFVYRKAGTNSANTLVVAYKPTYQP